MKNSRHRKRRFWQSDMAGLPASANEGLLEITLTYRERIAPPPDAVAEVMLLDVSRADAPAPRLSSQRFALTGVPMTVTLRYDPALIDETRRYSVSAAILSGDETLFRTTTHNSVFTDDAAETMELTLTRISDTQADRGASQRITGLNWAIVEIGGQPVTADDPPTLTLDAGGRFGLYSGCNRFSGEADISVAQQGISKLIFPENFAGTLMACPEERESLQRDVLEAIGTVTGYTRDGDRLTMMNADGTAMLRLREQPE